MSSKPVLRIDWATHEAARYACEKWHYSGCVPAGEIVKIGAWEADAYIGCVLFSRGANNNLGSPYEMPQTAICELTRIALRAHANPVSRIMAVAVRFLLRNSPGLRLIVSTQTRCRGITAASIRLAAGFMSGDQRRKRK